MMEEEEEEEEDNAMSYVSPRTKKRLQQQARLNLIVDSDSSESDNKNESRVIENSKSYIDSSDTSYNEDERFKNAKKNSVSEENSTNISHDKNIDEDVCINGSEKLKNYKRSSTSEKRYKEDKSSSFNKENIYDQSNQHQDKVNTCEVEQHNIVLCRYRPCNVSNIKIVSLIILIFDRPIKEDFMHLF